MASGLGCAFYWPLDEESEQPCPISEGTYDYRGLNI